MKKGTDKALRKKAKKHEEKKHVEEQQEVGLVELPERAVDD